MSKRALLRNLFPCKILVLLGTFLVICAFAHAQSPSSMAWQTVHTFGLTNLMGYTPLAPLVQASDGFLYGTASRGGVYNRGVIFRINADGTGYQVQRAFGAITNDGELPAGKLLEASDGMLYGTASWGGAFGGGIVYRLNKTGTSYTVLKAFGDSSLNGVNPQCHLLEGSDGMIYGETINGGSNNVGTLFRLQKSGSGFGVLYHFGALSDGLYPVEGVVEGSGQMLYGTCLRGGNSGGGTIFRFNLGAG
ncbi:MAG TPA: choice-of-anchor tandem repeat GloVer-containing protein, partial [Verrucomicrobiae bacterium]